eukprot:CAMPEP_0185034358 /NCGR_PEP_ID=MMETSP1103-20130426/24169_1 /TAXON_ID=36769 /ORGANISM="Paraphysomonas bandaiensis, Strain Caron Lab Isolate" /LENGTH=154 /DNA_ID=CAMNT_0027570987 /DNA_START=113 /DNA_END=577 /DNA_ORIENTATION=-
MTSIWTKTIGHDPYAADNDTSAEDSKIASEQAAGLLLLAKMSNLSGSDSRGACSKCGMAGHLTFQCRNDPKAEVQDSDESSSLSSSDDEDDTEPPAATVSRKRSRSPSEHKSRKHKKKYDREEKTSKKKKDKKHKHKKKKTKKSYESSHKRRRE